MAVQYVIIPPERCLQNGPRLLKNKLQARQCVMQIRNQDALCMARAPVVGESYADGHIKLYEKMYKQHEPQASATVALIKAAGLPLGEYTTDDRASFEKV